MKSAKHEKKIAQAKALVNQEAIEHEIETSCEAKEKKEYEDAVKKHKELEKLLTGKKGDLAKCQGLINRLGPLAK